MTFVNVFSIVLGGKLTGSKGMRNSSVRVSVLKKFEFAFHLSSKSNS